MTDRATIFAKLLTPTPDQYEKFLGFSLCVLPLVGALVPRALCFLPALVALLLCVAYRLTYAHWPALHRASFLWALAICTLMALSALWSVDADVSLDRALKTLPILLGGSLLFSIARVSNGKYFRTWFPWAVFISAVVCALQLYTHGIFYFMINERNRTDTHVNLFYLNRSDGSIILMVPVAITCALAAMAERKRQIFLGVFSLVLLIVASLTNSQSALLAFIIGLAFYFLFPVRRPKAWIALGAVLAVLIFASPWMAQWMFDIFPEYVRKIKYLRKAFALNRLEIWDYIARRSLERPVLGHGVEATEVIKDFDSAQLYNFGTSILHPHNFALQLWIELGIIGAVFGTVFLNSILRGMMKLDALIAKTALATFVMALSIASTGYGLWQPMWIGAYGLMFTLCLLSAPQDNKKPAG